MRADIMYDEDVRVIERADSTSFLFKAMQPIGIGRESRRQDLDGDIAAQSRIARAIHLAHPARSQGSENLVWTKMSASSKGH